MPKSRLRRALVAGAILTGSLSIPVGAAVVTSGPAAAAITQCTGRIYGRNHVFPWQQHKLYVQYGIRSYTVNVSYWDWFSRSDGEWFTFYCGNVPVG